MLLLYIKTVLGNVSKLFQFILVVSETTVCWKNVLQKVSCLQAVPSLQITRTTPHPMWRRGAHAQRAAIRDSSAQSFWIILPTTSVSVSLPYFFLIIVITEAWYVYITITSNATCVQWAHISTAEAMMWDYNCPMSCTILAWLHLYAHHHWIRNDRNAFRLLL